MSPVGNMSLISYSQFGRLRLRRFVPAALEVIEHDAFEWMDGMWWYEGVGFTWFGRLESAPEDTAGLELSFAEIPARVAKRVLGTLGLAVHPGITFDKLIQALGTPIGTQQFVEDRRTYRFLLGEPDAYEVGCTIHESEGLIHLSMIREDVRRRLAASR